MSLRVATISVNEAEMFQLQRVSSFTKLMKTYVCGQNVLRTSLKLLLHVNSISLKVKVHH